MNDLTGPTVELLPQLIRNRCVRVDVESLALTTQAWLEVSELFLG